MCNCKSSLKYNCIIILGPTAVGKTQLAVRIADYFSKKSNNAQIISCDSRQVYKGLDLGSGKDIEEYTLKKNDGTIKSIPYHLIDVTDLSHEYSVFDYQREFYSLFPELISQHILPVICGGTGMYLDSVVRGYSMIDVPMNNKLRLSLNGKTLEELQLILKGLKPDLHNTTDLEERHRLIRAIEIAYSEKDLKTDVQKTIEPERPDIRPFIIGTTFPRTIIRQKVRNRLDARLKSGMIDEVSRLYKECGSWERLERLGLEYRFVSEYLQGKFPSYEMLVEKLSIAIGQFVKRQETWFRGMEKKGIKINWLAHDGTIEDCKIENRMKQALKLLKENDINSINSFDI